MSSKVLGVITAIGGIGIGLPVYFSQTKGSKDLSSNNPKTSSTLNNEQEIKPIEKTECQVVPDYTDFDGFIKEYHLDESIYNFVSCKRTVSDKNSESLFEGNWTGLFPKDALNEVFSPKTGVPFEMNIESIKEEGTGGSGVKIVFQDPIKKSSIKGKLDISEDNGNREVTVEIEGNKYKSQKIYLFMWMQ